MIVNIHWAEFSGPVEGAEIDFLPFQNEKEKRCPLYKYYMHLKGYLPFKLFKDIKTKEWVANSVTEPSISRQVIFHTKKFIDDFEIQDLQPTYSTNAVKDEWRNS